MQKIADRLINLQMAAANRDLRPPVKLGPKGKPLAGTYWQDELPKIIQEFQIKHPADKRLWRLAKTNFILIEQKVAYIREQVEIDRKKLAPWQTPKLITEYTGLLLSLIFPKKTVKSIDA